MKTKVAGGTSVTKKDASRVPGVNHLHTAWSESTTRRVPAVTWVGIHSEGRAGQDGRCQLADTRSDPPQETESEEVAGMAVADTAVVAMEVDDKEDAMHQRTAVKLKNLDLLEGKPH